MLLIAVEPFAFFFLDNGVFPASLLLFVGLVDKFDVVLKAPLVHKDASRFFSPFSLPCP